MGLVACAVAQGPVSHSFVFDMPAGSRDAEVLDYAYGDSKLTGTRPEEWELKQGKIPQRTNVTGYMPRGDFLYVKWRVMSTGEIYERRVDLRNRLPSDMSFHRIYFVMKASQLYVYLISPEPVPYGNTPGPIPRYSDLKTTLIFPDSSGK
jgi:hypothetical protein